MSNIIHKRVVGREGNSEYKYIYTYTSALNFSYLARNFCPKTLGMKNSTDLCYEQNCLICWNKAILNHKKSQRRV